LVLRFNFADSHNCPPAPLRFGDDVAGVAKETAICAAGSVFEKYNAKAQSTILHTRSF
jgi:hypothetical protein